MITTEGIIIQIRMEDISTLGRITSGVKMMNVDENVTVAKIAKVRSKVDDSTDASGEALEEISDENSNIEILDEESES